MNTTEQGCVSGIAELGHYRTGLCGIVELGHHRTGLCGIVELEHHRTGLCEIVELEHHRTGLCGIAELGHHMFVLLGVIPNNKQTLIIQQSWLQETEKSCYCHVKGMFNTVCMVNHKCLKNIATTQ